MLRIYYSDGSSRGITGIAKAFIFEFGNGEWIFWFTLLDDILVYVMLPGIDPYCISSSALGMVINIMANPLAETRQDFSLP